MVKQKMNQPRKVSRYHNNRQSSMGETASVGSAKSIKSNGSAEFRSSSFNNNNNQSAANSRKNGLSKHGSQESADSGTGSQPASILNVAEMLLHGVADNEILDIWLRSIQCEELVAKFVEAGYDMPTISRITPQDLAAIGVIDPTKRLKILTEIKKLNLQDGIPNFRPASLSHWLSLIRLDSYYYQSLCDQQINSIEKLCQLTWEDFEELGISKLGHQKRFQLAIERLRELETEAKCSSTAASEPIYDTNPSQILLVASTENHSMNGPIINKQSSTSELSSTGSGSMHSVYSSASTQYQPSYAPLPDNQQLPNGNPSNNHPQQQQQQQAIYSQVPPPMIYQQPSQLSMQQPSPQQQSHYQSVQQLQSHQFAGASSSNSLDCSQMPNGAVTLSHQGRQSLMCQLPFSALANLPKHQQQQLQQSSIYATLSRQPPAKMKQPPPPVPIRTNSLKTPSMTDNASMHRQQLDSYQQQQQQAEMGGDMNGTLVRSGNRSVPFSSQTMLSKNKSFSGNAHMEASRARFLNRNSQQQPQLTRQLSGHLTSQQMQTIIDQNGVGAPHCNNANQNFIYQPQANHVNGFLASEEETIRLQQQQLSNNSYNKSQPPPGVPINGLSPLRNPNQLFSADDSSQTDLHSDTNSIGSLMLAPVGSSLLASPVDQQLTSSSTQDSGSSQTLYNSASSGASSNNNVNTDRQSLNMYNFSQPGDMALHSTTSSSTLADASNLTLDQQHLHQRLAKGQATTGRDDDFPPPPSPLSMSDSDEPQPQQQRQELGSAEANFTELTRSMMSFRVG